MLEGEHHVGQQVVLPSSADPFLKRERVSVLDGAKMANPQLALGACAHTLRAAPTLDVEDRHLRLVDDRRGHDRAELAWVGDRERAAPNLVRRESALPRPAS